MSEGQRFPPFAKRDDSSRTWRRVREPGQNQRAPCRGGESNPYVLADRRV